MWTIKTTMGESVTVAELRRRYPNLVAFDESAWEVEPLQIDEEPERLADAGYGPRDHRRILFWENEESSEDDTGEHAIAEARWQD